MEKTALHLCWLMAVVLAFVFVNVKPTLAVCFIEDVGCIAGLVLPNNQTSTDRKEWSAIEGYVWGYNNVIDFVFKLDDESLETLRYREHGNLGLEVEIIEKNTSVLELDHIEHNLPSSSNPITDTAVLDWLTNDNSNNVYALLIRNPEYLEKDKWYRVRFIFKNRIPDSGVNIQPNLALDLDVDSITLACKLLTHSYLCGLIDFAEYVGIIDRYEYYTLETDSFWGFIAYPDGREGVYWVKGDNKKASTKCLTKSTILSAINNLIGNGNPTLLEFFNFLPIKFTDSSSVYLVARGYLWPILNEQIYSLLGYRLTCSSGPDWSEVMEFDSTVRYSYQDKIKPRVIAQTNDFVANKMIAYHIVPKVGPTTCVSMAIDSTKIYLFGQDNKFHHIANEQVYYDLGYKADWSDVVDISPDLFAYYGEGEEITADTITQNPAPCFLGNYEPPQTITLASSYASAGPEEEEMPEPESTNSSVNISLPIPAGYYVSAPSEFTIFVMWETIEYKDEYKPYTLAYQTYRDGNPYKITQGQNYFYDTGLAPQEAHCYKTRAVLLDGTTVKYASGFTPQLCLATKPPRPVAKFEIDLSQNPELDISRPIIFKNTSTGTNLSYFWNFGDNATSTEKEPEHSFSSVGSYTVRLKVVDKYNRDSETEKTISIVDLPPDKPEAPRIE